MGTGAAPGGQHSTGGRSDAGRSGTHPPRLRACAGGSTICVRPPGTASAGHDSTMLENPPSGWHVRLTSSGSRFGGYIDCTR
jgi:hypothetical protein